MDEEITIDYLSINAIYFYIWRLPGTNHETPVNSSDIVSGQLDYLPPLIMAQDIKSAQILVKHKADVNARVHAPRSDGMHRATPLIFAVQHGKPSNSIEPFSISAACCFPETGCTFILFHSFKYFRQHQG